MEASEDEDIRKRVNSISDLESTSSGVSSVLGSTDDVASATSSSGDVSVSSSSSGEMLAALLAESVLHRSLDVRGASGSGGGGGRTARPPKCVGKNSRVTWGSSSVIGRRREMEDAVAVVPAFMKRACDHVGGCSAPGSRTSEEISPVHFFGVYDGHGGPQVRIIIIIS